MNHLQVHPTALRKLASAMLEKMPDDMTMERELVPGGDLRAKGNGWLRSSFVKAELTKVPREGQLRLAVKKLMAKKKIGSLV